MTWGIRPSTSKKNTYKLEDIDSDLSGHFLVPSYGNSLYYITPMDDATRAAWVRFMKQKSLTNKVIKHFVAQMALQHHKTRKTFRTDNGEEYVTRD